MSDPKFHPFWAKAEQLGVLVFVHPQSSGAPADLKDRLKGNGGPKDGPLKKKPTESLKQMYDDNIMFTPEAMRHLIAEVGASQLVIGIDFPYPWTKRAVDLVMSTPGLSDAERAAILGETAAKPPGITT